MTYDQAFDILETEESETARGADLGGGDETILASRQDKPLVVTHYPASVKAFYMEPDPMHPNLALCMDVLAPEGYGEIIGGASVSAIMSCCSAESKSTTCPKRHSSGIWICDATVVFPTPVSAWGSKE